MGGAAHSLAARAATQRGSVMIEALVSIVVTSMALLASAALAINAAKANQTGRYRAQAVLLVSDIAERISANPAAAAAGDFALAAGSGQPDQNALNAAPNCGTGACTPTQYAQSQMVAWRAQMAAVLPQATSQITFTAAAGATPASYAVTVNWVERSVGHGGSARTNAGNVSSSENFSHTATVVLSPQ
jgi:type IV pilus assembly protein PilV